MPFATDQRRLGLEKISKLGAEEMPYRILPAYFVRFCFLFNKESHVGSADICFRQLKHEFRHSLWPSLTHEKCAKLLARANRVELFSRLFNRSDENGSKRLGIRLLRNNPLILRSALQNRSSTVLCRGGGLRYLSYCACFVSCKIPGSCYIKYDALMTKARVARPYNE
jgi:hypothetical protein